jgi:hypothetical protein
MDIKIPRISSDPLLSLMKNFSNEKTIEKPVEKNSTEWTKKSKLKELSKIIISNKLLMENSTRYTLKIKKICFLLISVGLM